MNTESSNKLTFYTFALNCVAVQQGIKFDAQNKVTCRLYAKSYLARPAHIMYISYNTPWRDLAGIHKQGLRAECMYTSSDPDNGVL